MKKGKQRSKNKSKIEGVSFSTWGKFLNDKERESFYKSVERFQKSLGRVHS